MKKISYIIVLLFLYNCSKEDVVSIPNVNSGQINTIQTLGGSKNDVANSITKTSDGGYLISGYTQSKDLDILNKNDESFNFWILKYSSENNLVWQKNFGGTDDDRGTDIIATNDGGFAVLGYITSTDINGITNAGAQDLFILKFTINGTLTWQKSYGFSGSDKGASLIQTSDNGFLLTGVLDVSASGGQGNSKTIQKHAGGDVWAVKLNSNGNFEWSKYFGGSFTDTPFGVVETANNNYIIAASSDSNDFNISGNKGSYDFWVFKISAEGNLVWEKSFGGSEIDEPRAITTTNDGNFIVVGDTRSSDFDVSKNNGGADLWMIKFDKEGSLIWEKSIGASNFDVARSISKTQDNGFVIAGSSRSNDAGFTNNGQNDAWILKVDNSGKTEWQKFIGGSEIDFLYDAVELNNKTIIAVGESSSSNADITKNNGFSDALIIQIK